MTAQILVVDDEPDLEALILQRFRRQIRDNTLSFRFARDGVEALALIAECAGFELVVSDINMPGMDGLTLLARLQEAEDKLATIIVSAYGDMANIRTAMNCGAFDFLTKPIDFADLEATIAKTIRNVATLRDARQRQAEAERVQATLSRYFSPNLARELTGKGRVCDLEVRRREITSIFTDIVGFTTLVETLEPALLSRLLHDYLGGMTEIVFEHDGTVAKINGDALHILFGAPHDQPDCAARAVACALALDGFSQNLRADWSARDLPVGATRIGVHSGPALVGNFGSARFFEYTAYGDTINTAARLEGVNRQLGTRICVSATTAGQIDGFCGRPVGDLVLRGRSTPLRAFEPLCDADFARPTVTSYFAAFERLEAGHASAMPAFAALVGATPDDPLASFHLKRLLNGTNGTHITME